MTVNSVSHGPAQSSSDNVLQTITITRTLSGRGEGVLHTLNSFSIIVLLQALDSVM